jgi:hypothetical protein
MVLRTAMALAALVAAGPALADPMNADAARRFVVGKTFSFTCFEGTAGSGRIFSDGSVAGVVKIQGSGPTRFMHLPPGTLFAKGDAVCSQMKGAFFNPCFKLDKTSDKGFRGVVSGFGFMYCDFIRGREVRTASTTTTVDPAAEQNGAPRRASIRHGRPRTEITASTPAVNAVPVQPVTAEPLKPVIEQPAIRGTVAP